MVAAHEIPPEARINIYLVAAETILPDEASRNNLLAAIRAIVDPGEEFFLIIDVMRGTMSGSENDDEAAHAWTSAAEVLIAEGASILTITHSPYSEDGRMRGHSTSGAASTPDYMLKEKLTSVLKVERHKDHDSSGQWGFVLDEVEIEKHKGEVSLVPRLDGAVQRTKAKRSQKAEIRFFDVIEKAIGEAGVIITPDGGIPVKAAPERIVRRRYYAGTGEAEATEQKEMERQRKAFYRALKPAIDRKDVLAQPKDGERFIWLA